MGILSWAGINKEVFKGLQVKRSMKTVRKLDISLRMNLEHY